MARIKKNNPKKLKPDSESLTLFSEAELEPWRRNALSFSERGKLRHSAPIKHSSSIYLHNREWVRFALWKSNHDKLKALKQSFNEPNMNILLEKILIDIGEYERVYSVSGCRASKGCSLFESETLKLFTERKLK